MQKSGSAGLYNLRASACYHFANSGRLWHEFFTLGLHTKFCLFAVQMVYSGKIHSGENRPAVCAAVAAQGQPKYQEREVVGGRG